MRIPLVIAVLLGSFAANVFFVAGLSRRASQVPVVAHAPTAEPVPGNRPALVWSALSTDQPNDAIARLRDAGIPDSQIRSILAVMLDQQVIERRKELEGPAPTYWKYLSPQAPLEDGLKARAELRRMLTENGRLLDRLLGSGPPWFGDLNEVAGDLIRYADVPADKVGQMRQLDADYRELRAGVTSARYGITLPEDREIDRLLEQEKEKDVRALLSTEEYELYQMRNSPTGSSLRSNLATFDPTPEEFRQIFRLRLNYERQYEFMIYPFSADPAQNGRAEALKQMNDAIQAALGPDRGAVYARESDSGYRATVKVVAQLGSAPEDVALIWTMAKDFQGRISAVTSNAALSDREKVGNLDSLLQQASAQLTDHLGGAQGLEVYKRSLGGMWMTFAEAQRSRLARNQGGN